MVLDYPLQSSYFMTREPFAVFHPDGRKPKLGSKSFASNVDMGWFKFITGVEEKSISANA